MTGRPERCSKIKERWNVTKRILGIALILMLVAGSASAAIYTDVSGTPTQDAAVQLDAAWRDEAAAAYDLAVLPADQLTMDMVTDAYTFVYEEQNRPVRWYPEETQRAIEAMVSVDPDSLYLTEFMRLHAAQAQPAAALGAVMQLEISYNPGQTTVVVLGDTSDSENIVWTPVESRVVGIGRLEFEIPQDLMEKLQGRDVLFTLLVVRMGESRVVVVPEETAVPDVLPSKTAEDETHTKKTTRKDGKAYPDDFELLIVPETNAISQELAKIRARLAAQMTILSWLPDDKKEEVRCLLGDAADSLIVSEYVTLQTKDYLETSGDAVGTFAFATPFMAGETVITALGMPADDAQAADGTQMRWLVQRAVVRENGDVDVVFDQLGLAQMGTETALLLVLSEPYIGE